MNSSKIPSLGVKIGVDGLSYMLIQSLSGGTYLGDIVQYYLAVPDNGIEDYIATPVVIAIKE